MPPPSVRASGAALAAAVLLLGINLRTLFASLPPLLETVRADLGLSATASGLLTTGPVLLLGLLAPLAPWLARRIALERVVWLGLVATAGGLALRGGGELAPLVAGTLLAGAGVAVAQVALPVVLSLRFPEQRGRLTGVFSTSLTVGGTLAAATSVPLERALGGWPAALAFWALPAALVALVGVRAAAAARPRPVRMDGDGPWRSPLGWWLGVYFGVQAMAFYATLAWLPSILQAEGVSERDAGLLLALSSLASFAPAFLVPVLAARRRDQRGLLVATVGLAAAGISGLAAAPGAAPAWVVLIGAGQGAALGLGLILPSLRAGPERGIAPLMGMMQAIGYTMAATGPWLLGLTRDLTGDWSVPLLVLVAITVLQLPVALPVSRTA